MLRRHPTLPLQGTALLVLLCSAIFLASCESSDSSDEDSTAATDPAPTPGPPTTGTDNTAPTYAQTGGLNVSSTLDGGAGTNLVPAGMTNNAVGDVGAGVDNGDGTVGVEIPSVESALNLQTPAGASLTPPPPLSLYTTTLLAQCPGTATEAQRFACERLLYQPDDENASLSVLDSFILLDDRMQFFISDLNSGRKPYCLLAPESELVNFKSLFTNAALTTPMPDLFLSCYDNTDEPGSDVEGIDIAFGRKDNTWYLLEHVEGSRFQGASIDSVNGNYSVFNASYELYEGERRGGASLAKVQGETGYFEFSEDDNASTGCPKRVIWGTYSDNSTYIYFQDWRDPGSSQGSLDDTCLDPATNDPFHESCADMTALATDLPLSNAACTALKTALSVPKIPIPSDLAVYTEASTMRSTGKFADNTDNYRFSDAIVGIKREIFRSTQDNEQPAYQKWLGIAREILQRRESDNATELSTFSRAPCLRAAPTESPLTLPVDLGFKLQLNCVEQEEGSTSYRAFGIKDGAVYQWATPSSDVPGAGRMFFSRMTEDTTELWRFEREQSTFGTKPYGHGMVHLIADASSGLIEFVYAGETLPGDQTLGCGVQFKTDSTYIYAQGRFATYRTDLDDFYVDADCGNVPLQRICVDAETIRRTDLSNCTDRGLDFLTMKPLVPQGVSKLQSNAVEVNLALIENLFQTTPIGTISDVGDRGDWGAYNSTDATPDLNDPQYNQLLVSTVENEQGVVNTRANCRVTDELIAQGDERIVDESTTTRYELALSGLPTADKDALSVATGFDVVRVEVDIGLYGKEQVAPAVSTFSGTVTLSLVEGGTATELTSLPFTETTTRLSFPNLLSDRSTIASLEALTLRVDVSAAATSTCSEAPPADSSSLADDWGRATLTGSVAAPRLVY